MALTQSLLLDPSNDHRLEQILHLLLEKSGIAKDLSPEARNQLVNDTIQNLKDANVDLNINNINDPKILKGLMTALTATYMQNYAHEKGLKFEFDFRLIFERDQLSPEQEKRLEKELKNLELIERLTGDKLNPKLADEFFKSLDNALNPDAPTPGAPKPKFVTVVDENAQVVENTGTMAVKGQGLTMRVDNVEKAGWTGETEHLVLAQVIDAIDTMGLNTMTPRNVM